MTTDRDEYLDLIMHHDDPNWKPEDIMVKCNMADANSDCQECRHSTPHDYERDWCSRLSVGCRNSQCQPIEEITV